MTLDDLDRRVITELQQDGRRAFRDIARELRVSEATVRSRVRRLEDAGVLRFVAFADPAQLGQLRLALVLLTVAAGRHESVLAALTDMTEVAYVSTILGPADICAQVLVADDAALWSFVTERLRGLDGVVDIQTIVEVEVHKLRYAAPSLPG